MALASEESIKARMRANRGEIVRSIQVARDGNPYAAQPSAERRVARLQTKAKVSQREAEVLDTTIRTMAAAVTAAPDGAELSGARPAAAAPRGAEKVWGDTVDFVSVSFLKKGARIARAVGRVSYQNQTPLGTGFLIGNGLFLTNHHVIPSADFSRQLAIDFDYELDLVGNRRSDTRFRFDPTVFVTDPDGQDGLDFTIIGVGDRL
ncbi:trypsin-like peptidase domain-containing protein [Neorhizobium sp. JUb45]|uniref:trypsin-like serine peptidase n=1 Tax=Neorhizobium sp. JUb45 TaxID=2485113 RepID=UPI001044D46D|nr:trypsin-like peptidase domain-containing protein [Neorhizobium sp. JUb45]TCQ95807.1 hypothetical protein EDF70_12013 [Neorhizobium sp. JUb45]